MNTASLLFAGDFCPQLRVEELILKNKYETIYNDLLPELKKSDLNIVDLECPLVHSGKKVHKTGPHLKGHPQSVDALRFANIGVVAMANNHIRDYGAAGLLETIEHCKQAGISTIGVGPNLEEARKPFITTINGIKVAVLNIAENEWSNTYGEEAGASPLDLPKNFSDIQKAKAQCDFVIVVFHGGNEFYELPSPRLKETFRFFVEAGACAVIAHHTHVVSGYELYRGAPIFYSLGNFCFDWPGQRQSFWNTGMAVRLVLGTAVTFELIPFIQNSEEPGLNKLRPDQKKQFDLRLEALNAIIADDEKLKARFDQFCREKEDIYNIYLEPYRYAWLASLRKRKWIPSFFGEQKKRLILNITRCESHRDVFMKYLEK